MPLDKSDIEKIAWLARLSVDATDLPGYQRDLSSILTLVEQMNAVNTEGIEPMAHPLEIRARLRADEVTESNQREKFQHLAPAVEQGHYLVPRVVE